MSQHIENRQEQQTKKKRKRIPNATKNFVSHMISNECVLKIKQWKKLCGKHIGKKEKLCNHMGMNEQKKNNWKQYYFG